MFAVLKILCSTGGKIFRRVALAAWVVAAAGVIFFWQHAMAQPSFVTILTNGPSSNRLNIVLLSEGYTSNQLGQFLVDATNTVSALLSAPPFQEYKNYFNAFAIAVASAESGSDHPNSASYADTYFNSTYDDSDVQITIPPNFADSDYSHGQGRVDALLQMFMPKCQLPLLLVNDPVQGGSDNSGTAAIVSTASGSSVFAIHETGHVLANLGDEYTTANPGYPDTEEPNTTQETNYNFIKWKAWIDTNSTPIPTPPTFAYSSAVGLFEGAHYHSTGWYRPQLNCAMGNFSSPFCAVCSEALVLSFYQHVRPVENFSPANSNLSVATNQTLTFSLNLLQPATHPLTVQWLTNGMPMIDATNSAVTISASLLNSATSHVCARVFDPTALVRNDPSNLLTQTVTWIVRIEIPQMSLDTPAKLQDGRFCFRVTGTAPQGFVVETSSDLANWNFLTTNMPLDGEMFFTSGTPAGLGQQFFRAYAP